MQVSFLKMKGKQKGRYLSEKTLEAFSDVCPDTFNRVVASKPDDVYDVQTPPARSTAAPPANVPRPLLARAAMPPLLMPRARSSLAQGDRGLR